MTCLGGLGDSMALDLRHDLFGLDRWWHDVIRVCVAGDCTLQMLAHTGWVKWWLDVMCVCVL